MMIQPTNPATGQSLWPLHFVPIVAAFVVCVMTIWHPLLVVAACYFTWEGAVSWCYYRSIKFGCNVWESPPS